MGSVCTLDRIRVTNFSFEEYCPKVTKKIIMIFKKINFIGAIYLGAYLYVTSYKFNDTLKSYL